MPKEVTEDGMVLDVCYVCDCHKNVHDKTLWVAGFLLTTASDAEYQVVKRLP